MTKASRFISGLCVGVLLLALSLVGPSVVGIGTASAAPPQLSNSRITDTTNSLTASDEAKIQSAMTSLQRAKNVNLWVVLVDDFDGMQPAQWVRQAERSRGLGRHDVVLAIATVQRSYYLGGGVGNLSSSERSKAESAVRTALSTPNPSSSNYTAAAINAAKALEGKTSPITYVIWLVIIFVIIAIVIALILRSRLRRKRDAKAEAAEMSRKELVTPESVSSYSTEAMDQHSKYMLQLTDNAIRSSENELSLASESFDSSQTREFAKSVDDAKSALARAFQIRQQLDDDIRETEPQKRAMLSELIVTTERANVTLNDQAHKFAEMRNQLLSAPDTINAFVQRSVDVDRRIPQARAKLEQLREEFSESTLSPVADNPDLAQTQLKFAEENIEAARSGYQRNYGQQSSVLDSMRNADAALHQATQLLDAVDRAGSDIRNASEKLPAAIATAERGLHDAAHLDAQVPGVDMSAARNNLASTIEQAKSLSSSNPLEAFHRLTDAENALDEMLGHARSEKERDDHARAALAQAVDSASAQVQSANDFIETRRGAIGATSRTRLAEAQRHLVNAQDRNIEPSVALREAQQAQQLASSAVHMAQQEEQQWQAQNQQFYGPNQGGGFMSSMGGAMLGGLLINSLLGGGYHHSGWGSDYNGDSWGGGDWGGDSWGGGGDWGGGDWGGGDSWGDGGGF